MRKGKVFLCSILTGIIMVTVGTVYATGNSRIKSSETVGRDTTLESKQRHSARKTSAKKGHMDLRNLRNLDGSSSHSTSFDSPIVDETSQATRQGFQGRAATTMPSPGLAIGETSYEYQHNSSGGHQVGRTSGSDIVHFVWTAWNVIPPNINDLDRFVAYNSYTVSTNTLNQGFGGLFVGLGVLSRAGFINMSVGTGNELAATCHQKEDVGLPYNPWHLSFPIPGSALHVDDGLGGYGSGSCPEVLWPKVAASRDLANSEVKHVIAHSNTNDCLDDALWYWRYDGVNWSSPVLVDNTEHVSYAIADDPNSDNVAIVVHTSNVASSYNDIAYFQSTTDGQTWGPKTIVSNYSSNTGPQAWAHIAAAYDNSGTLHIVWDEQLHANVSERTAIRHWSSASNVIKPVAFGTWNAPKFSGVFNLNLAKLSLGIGDGGTLCQSGAQSNNNYLYVLFTRFGGWTASEQADYSASGYYNGELYLSVSNSGGATWPPPVNLSNTKTPGCLPGACASENWGTIGEVVDDIDILFVEDLDAGAAPQEEGTWQVNPVRYLRIPGGSTNAQHVCPVIAPHIEAYLDSNLFCPFNAPQAGSDEGALRIINIGSATLTGTISFSDFPGLPTLVVGGGTGPFTITPGGVDAFRLLTMSANGAAEGVYYATITITHNDASFPSPYAIPLEFYVDNNFVCTPENVLMSTNVASPGSLALEVSPEGRFAAKDPQGGLWRHSDSSSGIYDASLIIAHGTQSVDTLTFMNIFDHPANGQYGFVALSDMTVDSSAYGTGNGFACASVSMCTKDSVVGIDVKWSFPQDPSMKDEVVLVEYQLYRLNPSIPITNLAVGSLIDFDVRPAKRLGLVQQGVSNTTGFDGTRSLIWQQGSDTVGHTPVGTNTATRFRVGVALPGGFDGVLTGSVSDDFTVGGEDEDASELIGDPIEHERGPSDGFLYSLLQNAAGISAYAGSPTDLYTFVALDKGRSIAPAEVLTYRMVLASDTISEASFKQRVDVGLGLAATSDICGNCSCPCWADPQCDGVRSNVQDVVIAVNVAFRGVAAVTDAGCSVARADVDCDGRVTICDVIRIVNVAFRGLSVASQYCDPCDSPAPQLGAPELIADGSVRNHVNGEASVSAADAQATNSVVVESKTVAPNATGVQVGVFISNDAPLEGLTIPLEFREVTAGSYITTSFARAYNTAGRLHNSPLGAANPDGPAASITQNRYSTPGGTSCSAPGRTFAVPTANVDFVSPDATLLAVVSQGDVNLGDDIDLDPGVDPAGVPSYTFTFDVTGVSGTFRIDTCCVTPANHLVFAQTSSACDYSTAIVPVFIPGIITIGTPVSCATRTNHDNFLVTCPKGDATFHVQLLDGSSNPIVGNSGTYLDFSACPGAELIPVPGEHPAWPFVYADAPSDANGNLTFSVKAGGDCADCMVTINTDCGFTATVPVHSVDVNGDLCVSGADHHSSEGICRDYNADTKVNARDFGIHLDHLDHCGPAGTCDYLSTRIQVYPEQRIRLGDSVRVDWGISYNNNFGTCLIDSVVLYHFDCETEASLSWVASDVVGQGVFPSIPIAGQIFYENPDSLDFCIQARVYSPCCDSFATTIVRVTTERLCSPSDTCFAFYCKELDYNINDVYLDPPELENEGWSFLVSDVNLPEFGPATQTLVCVGSSPVAGTTGYVVIPHTGFGSPKIYKVTIQATVGDACGKTSDCGLLTSQPVPDCITDVRDVVCLINYIFRSGNATCPIEGMDVNCDDIYDVRDIVVEVGIVFRGQIPPEPCD